MERKNLSEQPVVRRALPREIDASWSKVDRRVVQLLCNAAIRQAWPVVMTGAIGSGKTCAAALAYASWPGTAKWFTAAEIVRLIQTARREGSVRLPGCEQTVGEEGIWRVRIDQPSMLVIDDLGIRAPTESQYAILYELIDRRVSARRPLIATSNHSLEQIAEVYDRRIASRLSAGMEIDFQTADRRPSGERYIVEER